MINEAALEKLAISWFEDEGYENHHGPDLNPESDGSGERSSFDDVLLLSPLRSAVSCINPQLPSSAVDDVIHQLTTLSHPVSVKANQLFHRLLRNGLDVSYKRDGETIADKAFLIDFQEWQNNIFWVVDQLTLQGTKDKRRPDLIVYVNGLPLAVIELKSPVDDSVGVDEAFNQLQTYRHELPDLAMFNEALIASDGIKARVGSLTASREWFLPWRYRKSEDDRPSFEYELKNVVEGFFDRKLFLEYVRDFVLFESDDTSTIKKIAGYHQFHGVRHAVEAIVQASSAAASDEQRGRGGVIWHTQGSGKSISMCCLAGKLIRHPELTNPTLVVVTDRNDLDGQLYETFCKAGDLLSDTPVQVEDRTSLRKVLNERQSGGIIFTTIQKFSLSDGETVFPALSDRRNIIVIADECHRSQYGFQSKLDEKKGAFTVGYAQHIRDALPNATFTGFTGTPVSLEDKDTQAVFGEYVSIYDIEQAQQDGATVPLFYESRLAKLDLNKEELPVIDDTVDELTEDEESAQAERTKGRWAALAKLVGSEPRLKQIAEDLVQHFEARLQVIDGKAMIVCMSREICVKMFDALTAIRPEWTGSKMSDGTYDPADGGIRIIMTSNAADPESMQNHSYSKQQKKALEKRFKDPADPLKIVIIRDMWLTGFDAPCAHTMYIDKPMKAHNLMQAIARVNRVFKGKPGGLVVDYIGIASELKNALHTYTNSGGRGGRPTIDVTEALFILKEKLQVARDIFHEFDYSEYATKAVELLPSAADYVVANENRKKEFFDVVVAMTRAQALCGTLDEAVAFRDEITFFQAVKMFISKATKPKKKLSQQEKEAVLNQLLAKAVVPEGVDDIFALAGLDKPDISILSDEFLEDVRHMEHRNLAVELLQKLINDEVHSKSRRNETQRKKFSERLKASLTKYRNRAIETAQVIEEMIQLAKELNEALKRGEKLGLNSSEIAFYDALELNESAVRDLGDEVLKAIARELTQKLRNSVTVDWQHKESVRAKMRNLVRRILKRYKYPPDAQKEAVEKVLSQAEELADEWSEES
ncbi:type I restriction endonuclease subunit R [Maridesulfovibrio salexigens]|uniref:Type I restriction enzyme endonuclease subunit n=1 Tax=Maridesulfovibrio salexigens (strain ATCC 14822 / DSM 2638 / NCIMB 8403 / VKM B-1763) TaxID=526222 RepID=C6BZE9_MARSD|nr:type I restriction endonuclease subunit R [Maridesulfovibrio salexigens]ACS80786.1 type I site-specific deoxyribonuclease, HsdR family [Maridesulfovibrio salexigens DSM 2638]